VTARVGRSRPRWALFLGLATAVVVLDQVTKAWLVGLLEPGERLEVVGELLRLVHGQNDGAIFGLFRDQALLFGLVSLGVVALIVWYHGNSGRNTLLSLALGLLLGGAIGNMIDRFRLGYVIDWVDAGVGDVRFYTFNVADAAITGAVLLLILSAVLPAPASAASSAPTGPAGEGLDA
jgi:signal peptidase II